ncbi:LPS-assembly lipoprotein [Halopseudomonas litoralis]|uniref:LPS-assembly lipoprotein LptE n=1 Tax=Halopseudomonas litoralis TaxID=797277 RepID=A0A1H1TGH6_9GAMM|nr:LPS assembly lipoprotein LptE [Halopseudomonas litoralis]SDS59377.1 LPS-assembly lipoprotein [Halopseudomonas litoralis]
MPLQRPRHLLSCAVLGASLLLSGCGFHLRGTSVDSVKLEELAVSARNSYGPTYQSVLEALQVNGVDIRSSAPYHLQLLDERKERRAVTYTYRSTPAEYELTSELTFQISDRQSRPLIGPETLSTQRVYVNDKDNLIGTSEEEALLHREMLQDLTRQLMFRLSSISASDLAAREQAIDRQAP